jgi:hypothetical protein
VFPECSHAGSSDRQGGSAQPGGGNIVYADDGQILLCGQLLRSHPRENRETDLVVVGADGRDPR